jgi:hypothetical protein
VSKLVFGDLRDVDFRVPGHKRYFVGHLPAVWITCTGREVVPHE